jgi:hypothetical protein
MNLEKTKYLVSWNRGSTYFPSLACFVYAGSTLNVQTDFQPGTYIDQREKQVKYSDFINKELILFSMADLQRSIPSMVDGLKPGQRKILFCSFKRNFVKEAKVRLFFTYLYITDYLGFIYLSLLLFLLATGGSVLWLCVRTLRIPPW